MGVPLLYIVVPPVTLPPTGSNLVKLSAMGSFYVEFEIDLSIELDFTEFPLFEFPLFAYDWLFLDTKKPSIIEGN